MGNRKSLVLERMMVFVLEYLLVIFLFFYVISEWVFDRRFLVVCVFVVGGLVLGKLFRFLYFSF